MPSKTTTKKPNSKSGLQKRFDLTNRKVQFFVVIAIVAVLGGGYFTVRSFAATTVASFQADRLVRGSGVRLVNEPAKNNSAVLLMAPSTSVTTPGNVYMTVQDNYRLCAVAKGNSTLSMFYNAQGNEGNSYLSSAFITFNNTGSYETKCDSINSVKSGYRLTFSNARGNLYLSKVYIERDGAPTGGQTAPSK